MTGKIILEVLGIDKGFGMACNVYVNKKLIMDCSVGVLETIYVILNKYIEQDDFYNNNKLNKLLHGMMVATESMCAYGFDFADYIDKNDVIVELLSALDNVDLEFKKNFSDRIMIFIFNLKKELAEYGKNIRA